MITHCLNGFFVGFALNVAGGSVPWDQGAHLAGRGRRREQTGRHRVLVVQVVIVPRHDHRRQAGQLAGLDHVHGAATRARNVGSWWEKNNEFADLVIVLTLKSRVHGELL